MSVNLPLRFSSLFRRDRAKCAGDDIPDWILRGISLENDVARFKEVHTGLSDANFVEILDGVTEGTRVITVGALALRDGDRVIIAGASKGGRGGNKEGGNSGGRQGQAPGGGSD